MDYGCDKLFLLRTFPLIICSTSLLFEYDLKILRHQLEIISAENVCFLEEDLVIGLTGLLATIIISFILDG